MIGVANAAKDANSATFDVGHQADLPRILPVPLCPIMPIVLVYHPILTPPEIPVSNVTADKDSTAHRISAT